ncbi:MAG TPA: DUF5666 domain-containing protein [Candidatus Sulfotelmatobacter sp.]|jgi:hypothetical protein
MARRTLATVGFAVMLVTGAPFLPASFAATFSQAQNAGQAAVAKRIGTIKAINGNTITLAAEAGAEVAVTVQPNARILRIAPGEKDLKNATPIQLQELQVGDTIRARGHASDDGKTLAALEIIVITRSTVAAVGEQIRQDWQKRGMGGLVCALDENTGTITVAASCRTGTKTTVVHITKSTVIRRYAPDSVKFEDAKPSTLHEIHVGDQLRARGTRSSDGAEITADEIVSGKFPYIEGTVKSVDASTGTLSVQDVLSKKTVEVKITPDSQLHKIPAEMAQRFAMRIKSALPPGMPGAASSSAPAGGTPTSGSSARGNAGAPGVGTPGAGAAGMGGGAPGGVRTGGAIDFQQVLSRLPSSTLTDLDLKKGDAVVILATEGSPSSPNTAITLLSGVEPILQASPTAGQAMMLAPWSLGGAPGGDSGP